MSYRILMIAPTSFFLDYGCHVRILEETRILQKFGHHVKIVTYPLGRDLPGLDIERTLPIPWRSSKEVGPSRSKILIDILLALKALQVALQFKPQVIHAHLHEGALIGGVLSRLMRVPLVFDFQGSLVSEMIDHHFIRADGLVARLMRTIEWYIDRMPKLILASSINAVQVLTKDFQIQPERVLLLPDCVDANIFAPLSEAQLVRVQQLRATLKIPPERKIVVYIGLLDVYRGTDVLLDAAARLVTRGANVHFVIVGFPNLEKYKKRAAELGIADSVFFPGRIPHEDMPLWLALGDVSVEPKMSATEAAAKVLEFMAMGLPVVAFDIPVMREYLGDLGLYAPLGDANALADQLAVLVNDPARARALGAKLRARAVEKFSWEFAGREIERVYDRVSARLKN